jgi:hypothetical protein
MSEFEIDLEEDDGFGSASAEGKVDIDRARQERDREMKRLRERITGRERDRDRDRDRDGDWRDRRANTSSQGSVPTGPRALQGRGGYQKPAYNSHNYSSSQNYNSNSSSFQSYNNSNYSTGYSSHHSNFPHTSNPDYPTNALHISGLDWWVNEEQMRDWIIEGGQPESEVRSIIFDDHKFNGRSKGVVYVEFNGIEVAKNTRQYIERKLNLKSSTEEPVVVIYVHSTSTPFRQSMTKSKSEQRRVKGQQQLPQQQQQQGISKPPQQVTNSMPSSTANPMANPVAGQMSNPGMMYGNPMMYGFPGFWMQPGYMGGVQGQAGTLAQQTQGQVAQNQNTSAQSNLSTAPTNGEENPHGVKRPKT